MTHKRSNALTQISNRQLNSIWKPPTTSVQKIKLQERDLVHLFEDLKINQQFLEKTYLYIQMYLDVKTRVEFMNQELKM